MLDILGDLFFRCWSCFLFILDKILTMLGLFFCNFEVPVAPRHPFECPLCARFLKDFDLILGARKGRKSHSRVFKNRAFASWSWHPNMCSNNIVLSASILGYFFYLFGVRFPGRFSGTFFALLGCSRSFMQASKSELMTVSKIRGFSEESKKSTKSRPEHSKGYPPKLKTKSTSETLNYDWEVNQKLCKS